MAGEGRDDASEEEESKAKATVLLIVDQLLPLPARFLQSFIGSKPVGATMVLQSVVLSKESVCCSTGSK